MTSPSTAVPDAVTAIRAAGERRDAGAVAALLAPGVVFRSPLSRRVRFEGRDEVAALHRDIFAVLEDVQTGEPLVLGDARAFSLHARVRGVELWTLNLVRLDDQGRIVEFTVYARPLPALATLLAALPPRVSARRRGRVHGLLVAAAARPLAAVLRGVDRLVPWFL